MSITFGRDRLPEPWPTVGGAGLPDDLTPEEVEEEAAMAATADAYAKAFGIDCAWDEERQAFVTRATADPD